MSSLENLIAKILSEAEEKAKEIAAQGKAQAEAAVAQKVQEANDESLKILSSAKKQADDTAEQIALQKTLKLRDDKLEAKQQILDRVFNLAFEKLNEMPKDEFFKLLSETLSQVETDGEKLTVPSKYNITNLDELNAFLKKSGKKGNLTLDTEPRKISGGFILSKDGIEQNNTFEELLKYHRHQLEGVVLKELF